MKKQANNKVEDISTNPKKVEEFATFEIGPLGPTENNKTPFNYFIKLRDTFIDSSKSVDYLMRLTDPTTGEKIGRGYVLVFQLMLFSSINSYGYLLDILGDRDRPNTLKYIPLTIPIMAVRWKAFFTEEEISNAIKELDSLNKITWSKEYKCYRIVDFFKHVGKETDYKEYYAKYRKNKGDDQS